MLATINKHTTTFTSVAQKAARGAHNSEVTGSKPVVGIVQFVCFKEADRHSSRDEKHEQTNQHRCGAEVARGAHNSEVTRSKRVSGSV